MQVHVWKSQNSIDFVHVLLGEPDKIQSVQNESYGVLGGGVPQSIELKDNAAYSTESAPNSQSIGNVVYKAVKADPVYDVPVNDVVQQQDCWTGPFEQ